MLSIHLYSPRTLVNVSLVPRKLLEYTSLQLTHIVTCARAWVKFMSSSGVQRSGTGSQTITGFGASRFIFRRAEFKEVQRDIHRAGEQTIWKDFDIRRYSGSESVSRRSFGVAYLKARFWFSSYPFQPLVVSRFGSFLNVHEVCHCFNCSRTSGGKSLPTSTIHPTVDD